MMIVALYRVYRYKYIKTIMLTFVESKFILLTMKKEYKGNFVALIAVFALLTCLVGSVCHTYSYAAAAQGDSFEVIFPKESYLQSEHPSLVAANDSYLIMYDDALKKLFVVYGGEDAYSYDLGSDSVTGLYAVGGMAFIISGDASKGNTKYYKLDISSRGTSPEEVNITSPEHVNYFNSNGSLLFAKAPTGNITVYNSSFTEVKRYYDDSITNDVYISGDNDKFYAYTFPSGKPNYNILSKDGNDDVHKEIDYTVRDHMYVGDVIYVNVHSKITDEHSIVTERNNIALVDKQTGEIIKTTDLCPDYFYASGRKLYAIEDSGEVSIVKVYELTAEDNDLTLIATISMAGDDNEHLNSPTDVIRVGGKTVVADSLNNRLAYIDNENNMLQVSLPSSPVRLASDGSIIYALCADGNIRYIVNGEESGRTLDGAANVLDIAYVGNTLYALTADGIQAKLGDVLLPVASEVRGRRIASAAGGNNLYILSDDKITVVNKSGKTVTVLSGEFAGAKDIAIDYAGDIFAIYGDRMEKYLNTVSGAERLSSVTLTNSDVNATANSICLDGANAYFTATECLVGKLPVEVRGEENFSAERPNVSPAGYGFYRLSAGSYYLPYTCRAEQAYAATDEVLLVLDSAALISHHKYALMGSELIVVPENALESVDPTALTGRYDIVSDETLCKLPYSDEGKIAVAAGTTVTLLSDCAGYDSNVWSIVQYEGEKYFVRASQLKEHTQIETPPDKEGEEITGRANAGRVGGLVGIYSDDNMVDMLVEIVDGTRVEVISQYEDCYLVKYGDTIGYMRPDEVKIGGLTTVQIVSIVLAIVVLLTGTGIYIAIYLSKQELDKQDDIGYKPEN